MQVEILKHIINIDRVIEPRDWTQVSFIAGGFFTNWAIREAPL